MPLYTILQDVQRRAKKEDLRGDFTKITDGLCGNPSKNMFLTLLKHDSVCTYHPASGSIYYSKRSVASAVCGA
jgi:hypothetical protein